MMPCSPRQPLRAARLYRLAAAGQCLASAHARSALTGLASVREYVAACCAGCGATRATHKLKKCAKCDVARFCGAECQRRAWAEHKPHCTQWAAQAAGAEP